MPAILEFVGVYDQKILKPKTFIRDMYFGKHEKHEQQKFEIEYRKGGQLVAPFVSEMIPGTEMIKRGYESKYYATPKVAPKRTFTGHELFLQKTAGETIYGGMSPDERKAKMIAESFEEFEEQIARREEAMCIETLFKGEVLVKGEGVEDKITYGTVEEISAAVTWDQANADITGDIEATITKIGETTGQRVEFIVMDPVAAKLFVNNEKIQKLLDNRNYDVGKIAPKDLPSGAIYLGTLAPYGTLVYSYQVQHQVLSEDGKSFTVKKLIPEGRVLFAPTNNILHYGAAVDVSQGIIVAERVPFEDIDSKANTVEIRIESRPLPVPFDIDAIKILKVK
ncbi:MAG TPA: major capsid protein [Fusobacterium sp.]|uniref:major capsid protein n=1 Tax=Fusobacterium sp. TaxID=68766 RepID=UPI002F4104EC